MLIFVGINVYYGYVLLHKNTSPAPAAPASQSFTRAVPDFTLIDQNGDPFSRDDLKGQIWVAAFVFTRCPGPCPAITGNLAQMHQEFKDSDNLHLVSFSIDPKHDTPQVLTEYAQRFQADLTRWTFLTGEQEMIHDLSMNGFYSAVMETTPETAKDAGPFIHGTRIYVVDASGTIVAAYDGTTPEGIAQTKQKLHSLLGN